MYLDIKKSNISCSLKDIIRKKSQEVTKRPNFNKEPQPVSSFNRDEK